MKRRELLPLLAAGLSAPALAQAPAFEPKAGVHFRRLARPQTPRADGRIEVLEYFWYGCPHCYAFEPALQAWQQKMPAHVSFKQIAVPIRGYSVLHQRLFFTLQAMGVEGRFRMAIFDAIQEKHQDLATPADMVKLLQPLGLDVAQFSKTWNAFDPRAFSGAQIAAANRQSEDQEVDAVPTLIVGGLYMTSPSMAGVGVSHAESNRRAIVTLDHLIQHFGKV